MFLHIHQQTNQSESYRSSFNVIYKVFVQNLNLTAAFIKFIKLPNNLDYTKTKSWFPWWLHVLKSWWVIIFHFPWQFLTEIAFHVVSWWNTPCPVQRSSLLFMEVGWHSTQTSACFCRTLAQRDLWQALPTWVTLYTALYLKIYK